MLGLYRLELHKPGLHRLVLPRSRLTDYGHTGYDRQTGVTQARADRLRLHNLGLTN